MNANTGYHPSNGEYSLPPGWRRVRLGDLLSDSQSGFACGERDSQGVIQLRMNNVSTRGAFVWDDFIRVPADHEAVMRYQLVAGDVLFNNTNSTELVGKSALFQGHAEPVVYSNHFTRLRADTTRLEPVLLAFWLNQQWQSGVFERLCNRWIGQSAVKNDKLLNLEIPLPPLLEQHRIVAILQEQMAAVKQARAAAEAQLAAAKALPAAYLRQVFPKSRKTPRNDLRWVRLGDVCKFVNGDAYRESDWSTSGVPIIRIQNLNDGSKPFNYWHGRLDNLVNVSPGDLLLAWSGTPGTSFGAHIWKRGLGVLNQHIFRVDFDKDVLWSSWLVHAINQQLGILIGKAHGGVGLRHVTRKEVDALTIPLLPLIEQRRIAEQLDMYMAVVERLRSSIIAQLDTINALSASILQRAFRGEL